MSSKSSGWASAITFVACLGLFAGAVRSEESLWMTDFAAAKAKAKSEKKLMLVDFTGSDWCGWCIKLRSEVFDMEAFKTAATKKFVLVELDYPQTKVLPEALKAQNEKLQQEYKIQGFPTIYVMDADGKAVAKSGYQPGGPEKYLEHLDGFVKAHETVIALQAKLPAAKGIERAKILDQLLTAQESLGLESEDDAKFSAEILTLDADNKAGLKTKYSVKKLLAESEALGAEAKFDEAAKTIEKILALPGITAEQKLDAYFGQGGVCFNQKDFAGVVTCLNKAHDAAPASSKAKRIEAMIKQFQPLADAQKEYNTQLAEANKQMKGKDIAKAEAALTKALAVPNLPDELKESGQKLKDEIDAAKAKDPAKTK